MKKKTNTKVTQAQSSVIVAQTNEDFKNSILIVSVFVNVFILTAWLVAQASREYAAQLVSLI